MKPFITPHRQILLAGLILSTLSIASGNSNVHITRFWHNHQPIYWPEWNSGVGQDSRVQYAHDSMRLKPNQNYGASWNHPHNDLEQIFGLQDRIAAYQGRPRDSVTSIGEAGGMAMSYTGSLIDNIRNLSANNWGYGGDWNSGNTQARQWTTTRGGPRLDLVGFSYHHSLTPLLPREVLRREIQIFKEAWWKAWDGNPDKSDHSMGFFPTEMAYSRDIIDVLVEEGYEWVIVASHHISRTSPSYNDRVHPGNFQIKSSPPNRADQLGPRFDNPAQWWFAEPNPGQAAWNVAPFAYQLHRVEYVDPETGDVKSMIAVPSDDVLSYQAGYSGAQIGLVDSEIAPWATDPNRPLLVMPATDGDNAWGGGYDSWMVSTPAFFRAAQSRGYQINSIQDFVNEFGEHAPTTHIEEGAWIYPEMCYGSPYFLKWIEPPVRTSASSPTAYPDTIIDMANGWSLKFFAYAPKMAGANWVITAEQILRDQGGDVQPWKIQAPYDWDGTWTEPNDVELAWHIYLKGLDSGFQYYGGLGNDDETKPGLAARRAIETLHDFMSTRMHLDETGPTVLKPQRFPWNPGGYTFGWFNSVPEADQNFLKKHPSEFYIWTLAHDLSGIETLNLKIRHTLDNEEFRNGHHQNLTYAGGPLVSDWVSIPMTRRELPNTRAELNAIANHGEIDFVVTSPEIADHYYVMIDNSVYPDFRGRYFDYYIEAVDSLGNITRTEIQHVFVEDDGNLAEPPATPGQPNAIALSSTRVRIEWGGVTGATTYRIRRDGVVVGATSSSDFTDTGLSPETLYTYTVQALNSAGSSDESPPATASTLEPQPAPGAPQDVTATALSHTTVELEWVAVPSAGHYRVFRGGVFVVETEFIRYTDTGRSPATPYTYTVVATNEGGDSPPSAAVVVTTLQAPPSFDLAQADDPMGYLLDSPGMRIFAAVRGTLLYVATWTPTQENGNDHFILVTDELEEAASLSAPWAKAGFTALPADKPYLAGESENSYAAWFNTGGHGQVARSEQDGGRLEGVIDLVQVFGNVPERIFIAALAYQTQDGGLLAAQAPAGDGDGNVDPSEFLEVPVTAIRDSHANGVFDRLDPTRDFRLNLLSGAPTLDWPAVPGRTYTLLRAAALSGENAGWTEVGTWTAPSGADRGSFVLPPPNETPAAFYTLELLTFP